jgi:energy-converting hydrogenase B subunit D
MIEYILMITAIGGAIIALIQRDLLKAAILTAIPGTSLAFLYQYLMAPDVALTQAIVGSAIVPVFIALAVKKTRRTDEPSESEESGGR